MESLDSPPAPEAVSDSATTNAWSAQNEDHTAVGSALEINPKSDDKWKNALVSIASAKDLASALSDRVQQLRAQSTEVSIKVNLAKEFDQVEHFIVEILKDLSFIYGALMGLSKTEEAEQLGAEQSSAQTVTSQEINKRNKTLQTRLRTFMLHVSKLEVDVMAGQADEKQHLHKNLLHYRQDAVKMNSSFSYWSFRLCFGSNFRVTFHHSGINLFFFRHDIFTCCSYRLSNQVL